MKAILGEKLGMTQIFDDEARAIPVTVIKAGPCHVTQIKTTEIDGYSAVQISFDEVRVNSVNKPVAGHYAKELLWPNAGVGPEEIDVTGSYDAFTFTTMLQLEDYGFCTKGDGGEYVSDGTIELGGRRPNNTSGGHLCEGYTHGMSMVIENVRQLRGAVDDSCPIGPDGRRAHTYDYSEGGCRQVRDAELSANLGWATPATGSALVLQKG